MGKLIREVYEFERTFEICIIAKDNEEPYELPSNVDIKVFLHINHEKTNFYIDLNEAFSADKSLVVFPSMNCFGNFKENASAMIEFYNWLGDIVIFAVGVFEKDEPVETIDMGCEVDVNPMLTSKQINNIIKKNKRKKKK